MAASPVMTNEALKAFIKKHDNKIFFMMLTDCHRLLFGVSAENVYSRAKTTLQNNNVDADIFCATEIEYDSPGGVDMFGYHRCPLSWGKRIPYTVWIVTSTIQFITVSDNIEDDIPDIMKIM